MNQTNFMLIISINKNYKRKWEYKFMMLIG